MFGKAAGRTALLQDLRDLSSFFVQTRVLNGDGATPSDLAGELQVLFVEMTVRG